MKKKLKFTVVGRYTCGAEELGRFVEVVDAADPEEAEVAAQKMAYANVQFRFSSLCYQHDQEFLEIAATFAGALEPLN